MPQTFQNLLGIKGCPLTELFHCAQTGRQWEHANTQVTNGAPFTDTECQLVSHIVVAGNLQGPPIHELFRLRLVCTITESWTTASHNSHCILKKSQTV